MIVFEEEKVEEYCVEGLKTGEIKGIDEKEIVGDIVQKKVGDKKNKKDKNS